MAKAKKLPSGNWNILLYAGTDENGKRRYESITAPTKKEAEFRAAEWKMRRPKKGDMTLREAYRQYCDSRSNVLSASTLKEYRRIIESSKYPIMDMNIMSITLNDVQKAVNEMSKNHSPKTVRNHHGLFSAVIGAYREGVAFKTTLPQRVKKSVYIPEPDTIKRLYGLLQDSWLFVPFILASQCGLRASEIAGLQYKHIKPDRILVRQARVAATGGTAIKGPKTTESTRDVRCSPKVIALLGKGNPNEFVVPHSAWQISDSWGDFMRAHPEEVYFSFHKLRHFFASNTLLLGVPKRYVATMMGHKSEHMLDEIYEHVFGSAQEVFGDRVAASGDAFMKQMQDAMQNGFSPTPDK